MKKKTIFWLGIFILAAMFISYFVKVRVDQGTNFILTSPLLGVLIFNNPFILGIYILIAIILIVNGIKN